VHVHNARPADPVGHEEHRRDDRPERRTRPSTVPIKSARIVSAVAPLTATQVFTGWSFDPATATAVIVLAAIYLIGVRRASRVRRWPPIRTVLFIAVGLGSWAFSTMSLLGTYDTVLFWPRAIQTVLLLMVTPLFLALGMPITLLMRALPPTAATRLRRFGRSGIAKLLTFPAVISALLLGTPFVLFFTPIFDAVLNGGAIDMLVKFWLVGVGWAYYWTRLQVDPVPHVYPVLVSMWITFAEVIFDGGLGLLLMLGHTIVGLEHYQAARTWGPTPSADQQMGGAAFWIIGDLSGLPFLAALFRKWVRDDEERTIEVDRELDAQETAARLAVVAGAEPISPMGTAEAEPDDGMQRPWWETDPARLRR
jgi:cytochrome c oxidase assembly factor CtaG